MNDASDLDDRSSVRTPTSEDAFNHHARGPIRSDPMSSNPFIRADAWRAHPLLNKPWGHAFPGLALGAALFAGYVAMDKAKSATAAKKTTTKTENGH
jgi:hypothetical protein